MNIQEAYNIMFNSSGTIVSAQTLGMILNEEKLRKQHKEMKKRNHPDAHIKDGNIKYYTAVFQDIELAYEILHGYLEDTGYYNPYTKIETAIDKYYREKNKTSHKHEKTYTKELSLDERKKMYLVQIERIHFMYLYSLLQEFFNYINVTFNNIKENLPLEKLADRLMNYSKKDRELDSIVRQLESDFVMIKKRINILDGKYIKDEEIIGLINKYISKYNTHIDAKSDKSYKDLLNWKKNKYEIAYQDAKKKEEYIKLIERQILLRQIEQSNHAYNICMYKACRRIFLEVDKIIDKLNGDISDERKFQLLIEYDRLTKIAFKDIKEKLNRLTKLKNTLVSFKEKDELPFDYLNKIMFFEQEINLLVAPYNNILENDKIYKKLMNDNLNFQSELEEYDKKEASTDIIKRKLTRKLITQIINDGNTLLYLLACRKDNQSSELAIIISKQLKKIETNSVEELFAIHNAIYDYLGKYTDADKLRKIKMDSEFTYTDVLLEKKRIKELVEQDFNKTMTDIKKYYTFFIWYYGMKKQEVPEQIVQVYDSVSKLKMAESHLDYLHGFCDEIVAFAKKNNIHLEEKVPKMSDEFMRDKKEKLIAKIEETYEKVTIMLRDNDYSELYKKRKSLDLPDLYNLYQRLLYAKDYMIYGNSTAKPSRK